METLLRVSDQLRRLVEAVGRAAKWLIVPMIVVTMWDVITRKIVALQLLVASIAGDALNSTVLQELEWHLHTGLFALCLGFGYVRNVHVRIDILTQGLRARTKAWIELLGCGLFLIPYCLVVIFFAWDFVVKSYAAHEISASMIGLGYRWAIKSVLLAGMVLALLAGIAVLFRLVVFLFGPRHLEFDLLTIQREEAKAAMT
jgi:TRAP-type mannitol/chloroaromatic compound transport system permease small subunit